MATKINSEDRVVESLSDKCSRDILGLTSKKEYSAFELSNELNIPLSTIYRKLKLLEGCGLIQHVKTIINPAVNEEKYYRCVIREATVSFKDGLLSVSLKKEDCSDKFVRLWKRLSCSDGRK